MTLTRHALTVLALGITMGFSAPTAQAWPSIKPTAPTVVLPDFSVLTERVGPAVVNVRTTQRTVVTPAALDPRIEEMLKKFGLPIPKPQAKPEGAQEEEVQKKGLGSGFILASDGYVLTNAHVVQGAEEVVVTLADKRELKARVIGADARTDVAVLKIEATGLPSVKIGKTANLKVGEWVMAIGSPFGLDNTVTAGIVSAKQRDTGDLLPLIQTDVAINPGNSGGPLINMEGEVVGINSQIYSRSGGFMGISFAIPIDEAMRVANELRAAGKVVRGKIGVKVADVDSDISAAIGLERAAGALIQALEPDGPAEKSGLMAGDVILSVDSIALEKAVDLTRQISNTRPGSTVKLQIVRNGEPLALTIKVAESKIEADEQKAKADQEAANTLRTQIGLTVVEITDAEKKQLRLDRGVRIKTVDGVAAKAGLKADDIVLSLNNKPVLNVRDIQTIATQLGKVDSTTVLVRRSGLSNYILLKFSK